MKYLPFLLFLFAAQSCGPQMTQVARPATEPATISVNKFLSEATYYGLVQDNFSIEAAKSILANEQKLFVTKCPICTPTVQAFRRYIAQDEQQGKTFTPKSIIEQLTSEKVLDQQKGLKALIQRYTNWHYDALGFSAQAKERLEKMLLDDRKRGMDLKRDDFGKFCPSCDGACCVPE